MAVALLVTAPAHAQNLTAYREVSSALSRSGTAREQSAAAALHELDRAEAALAELQPSLRNGQVSHQIEQAMNRARGALARTPAEVQAQTAFAGALVRQALYEQTLSDLLQEGQSADTAERLSQLAQDFALSDSEAQALIAAAGAGQPEAVAARLQRAAARQVMRELEPWSTGQGSSQAEAYLHVARASGWQLHLAALEGTASQASYNSALQQLAAGDLTTAAPELRQLYKSAQQDAQQLQQALDGLKASTPTSSPPISVPPQPTVAKPATTKPAATTAVSQVAAAITASASAPASASTQDVKGTAALAPTYSALARALAAVSVYDHATASAELKKAAGSVSGWPADWQAREGRRLATQLRELVGQTALRPGDITAQIVELRNAEARLQNNTDAPLYVTLDHRLSYMWNGRNQALAFFLLALLGPVPLYYKAQALGRHDVAWRFVSAGISLLLVPLIIEGIAAVAAWLGEVTGQDILSRMASLSIRYDLAGQFAWWLCSLAGVLLLTEGFRRLSRQRHRTTSARQRWDSLRHSDPGQTTLNQPEPQPTSKTAFNKVKTLFGKTTTSGTSDTSGKTKRR